MKTTMKLTLAIGLGLAISGCGKSFEVPTDYAIEESHDQGTENSPVPGEPQDKLNPASDPKFTTLPNGKKLESISVSGRKLSLTRGKGSAFTSSLKTEYQNLKKATQTDPNHKVQWALMDLGSHQVVAKSLASNRKLFGASSSKIYVGAALVERQSGVISTSQLQLMANMLVVSSNVAWTDLQTQLGDGSSDKGRERVHNFTQKMGYLHTRGYQGYWGKTHGNELIADEAVETLYDLYQNNFAGASIVWKLMHTCRTGTSRGLKYIPSNIYVGGKTGTYSGPTENPENGATYNVSVRNHILTFYVGGRQFGLAILANSGSDQSAAVLAGGLIREYGGIK